MAQAGSRTSSNVQRRTACSAALPGEAVILERAKAFSVRHAGNHEKNQNASPIGMAPRNQRTLIANSAAKDRSAAVFCIELILMANCEKIENLRLNQCKSATLCDRGWRASPPSYPAPTGAAYEVRPLGNNR